MVDLEPIDVPPGGDADTAPPDEPTRRGLRRRVVIATGAAIIVLLVGGLMTIVRTDRPGPSNVLSRAFDRTAKAGSARVVETIEASGSGPDEPPVQATRVDGIVGFGPVRGTLRINTGAAAFAGAPGTTTLVLTGDALYTQSDAIPADAHGGRHWFRSARSNRSRIPGPFSIAVPFSNNTVRGPATGVRRVGPEHIGGVATTRYTAHLLLEGHDPLVLDVWIDGPGRIRRYRETTPGTPGSRFELTVDYTELGVAVPDDAPPPNDVIDQRPGTAPPGVIDAA